MKSGTTTPRNGASNQRQVPGAKRTNKPTLGSESIVTTKATAIKPISPSEVPAYTSKALEMEKKAKQINKKLKQIEVIKQRIMDGESVELTQKSKLQSEEGLRKQLEELTMNS